MQTPRVKNFVWWTAATAMVLLSLLASTLGCAILHPSKGPDGLVHQPASFRQREALVTPGDPAVIQALAEALNPPPQPTSTFVNGVVYQIPLPPTPGDFKLIVDWVDDHCGYTQDIDTHGISDYWQTPAQTIASGKGDCEDYSILLCAMLRATGVPDDEVYVAVGTSTGDDHAWLVERYSTGIWLLHDSQPGTGAAGLELSSVQTSSFLTSYCFNDATGFNGEPVLPAGIFEFQSLATSYPFGDASTNRFIGRLNAGQKITALVDWLPYAVEWPFNPLVVEPWNLNIYSENGDIVYTWSGTDLEQAFGYTATQKGTYRIEIFKRDERARPSRLTLTPAENWEAANQKPVPEAGKITRIGTPLLNTAPPWKDNATAVPAPVDVPRDTLVQTVLDAINAERVLYGLPAIVLGTNAAAQQHADDMMTHRFVSDWGTDGSGADQRYSMAGGLGNIEETDQALDIEWHGDPGLFKSALLGAIEQVDTNSVFSYSYTTGSSVNGVMTTSVDPRLFKTQPDRVNIGVAYDGEKVYVVLSYETFFGVFSQLPTISDGILSFSGELPDGLTLGYITIYYMGAPKPLTASQISYAYYAFAREKEISIKYSASRVYAILSTGYSSGFVDPHSIPLSLPPLAQSGLDNTMFTTNLDSSRFAELPFNSLKVNGREFSFSLNLGLLLASVEKGVYTISIRGQTISGTMSFISNVLSYTLIVD